MGIGCNHSDWPGELVAGISQRLVLGQNHHRSKRIMITDSWLHRWISREAARYVVALLITVAALAVRELLNPVLGDLGPFLSVYVALTVVSVYLGAGPATLTALLGLLGSTRFFMAQDHFSFDSRFDFAYAVGYLLVAATIIVLAERGRRALAQVKAARDTLEEKVEVRTQELQIALSKLQDEMRVRSEADEARRKLSAHMLNLQDEERRRIARELHDSMGQTLAALKMTVSPLASAAPSGSNTSKRLDEAVELIDDAIRETRTLSHLLHPPMLDELGFAAAANWYVTGFARRSGIDVKLELPEEQRFPDSTELTLFRVLQESLTNILRHSESKSAEVCLEISGNEAILSVRDYGKGIPVERLETFMKSGTDVGVGLGGMRERIKDLGGKLEVQSPGVGTKVKVTLPFTKGTQNRVGGSDPKILGLTARA
jgi:signal transduction histidine kinase